VVGAEPECMIDYRATNSKRNKRFTDLGSPTQTVSGMVGRFFDLVTDAVFVTAAGIPSRMSLEG
jgi:hypothetical protein